MKHYMTVLISLAVLFATVSCGPSNQSSAYEQENQELKELLSGNTFYIWSEEVTFRMGINESVTSVKVLGMDTKASIKKGNLYWDKDNYFVYKGRTENALLFDHYDNEHTMQKMRFFDDENKLMDFISERINGVMVENMEPHIIGKTLYMHVDTSNVNKKVIDTYHFDTDGKTLIIKDEEGNVNETMDTHYAINKNELQLVWSAHDSQNSGNFELNTNIIFDITTTKYVIETDDYFFYPYERFKFYKSYEQALADL